MNELIKILTSPICIIFYGGIIYFLFRLISIEQKNTIIQTFISSMTLGCAFVIKGYINYFCLIIIWAIIFHILLNLMIDEKLISLSTSITIILNVIMYFVFNIIFFILGI